MIEESDISTDLLGTCLPYLLGIMAMELIVGFVLKKRLYRLSDTINNISHGMIEQLIFALTTKGIEFVGYLYVWNNFAIVDLPSDSSLLWAVTFLGVDLCYYWFHRMAHEINFLWASHGVHHSSEEMNLSIALRQSIVQVYLSWIFYLPLALIIPPPLFYTHKQLNTLYQFWIHTKAVGKIGPLEYILNTPSHHRVHHGRNPRYLDKNYAGILIIWDRLFGTFQEEDEVPVYGLVHPLTTWDVLYGQFHHYLYMAQRIYAESGFFNKLAVIWKGPGWHVGTGRLGDIREVPAINYSQPKYDPQIPTYLSVYVVIHFIVVAILSFFLFSNRFHSYVLHVMVTMFLIFSLQTFAAMFDRKPTAIAMEVTRIFLFLVAEVVCWFIYKDDFVFLWYKQDEQLLPGIHRPVRILRVFFLVSLCWIVGRFASLPSFFSTSQYKSKAANTVYKVAQIHTASTGSNKAA